MRILSWFLVVLMVLQPTLAANPYAVNRLLATAEPDCDDPEFQRLKQVHLKDMTEDEYTFFVRMLALCGREAETVDLPSPAPATSPGELTPCENPAFLSLQRKNPHDRSSRESELYLQLLEACEKWKRTGEGVIVVDRPISSGEPLMSDCGFSGELEGKQDRGSATLHGFLGGFLLGIIGLGLVVILQKGGTPSPAARDRTGCYDSDMFLERYRESSKSERRNRAALGGLLGTALGLIVVGAIVASS